MRVGVVGATGYVGSELLRWIGLHPELECVAAVSTRQAGVPIATAIPSLLGVMEGCLVPLDPDVLSGLDAVFLATPHGAAAPIARTLRTPLVIDCSADHRHADGWVYGQPEWNDLRGAPRIAAPGCFATALELALAPLVQDGLIVGPAMVTAATGSTGSGATPSGGTHHPLRANNLRSYKTLGHQHVPEVGTFLAQLGDAPAVNFVPLSAPVDRGIFASVLVQTRGDARASVQSHYAASPLIRFREGSPELRHVRGTAFADLTVHQRGDTAAVLVALDNLGKGAASQAVQALNGSLGWPTDHGLRTAAVTP